MPYVIEKDKINDLVLALSKKRKVYAPHKKNKEVHFKQVSCKSKIVLGYRRTLMSTKQYFLPAKEKTFSYDVKKKKLSSAKAPKEFILFGLSYPDLQAITYLDEIMRTDHEDFFYSQKRRKATIIGLINKTITASPGGDLILEKINEKQYKALVLSVKGQRIVRNKLFKQIAKPKIVNYPVKLPKLKELTLDSELLAEAVEWSWNRSEIWDDLAKTCLGCGICTYVCPLCFCFSNEDRVSLDNKECSRCRSWDSCVLPGFSKVAGNHNFHGTLKERYYNWFYHKFVRGYREYGRSLCVACGRCQKYCPAGIDIEDVLKQILKEYLRAKK